MFLLNRAYTESRSLPWLTPPHQKADWGSAGFWELAQLGQLTPTDKKDVTSLRASCSAHKGWGRRRGHSEWWCFVSPSLLMCYGGLLFWRWLNNCLLMGSGELIPGLNLLLCSAFSLSIILSLYQHKSFPTIMLPILFPIPLWWEASGE